MEEWREEWRLGGTAAMQWDYAGLWGDPTRYEQICCQSVQVDTLFLVEAAEGHLTLTHRG